MEKCFVYSNFAITFDNPNDAHKFVNDMYSFLQKYSLFDKVSIYDLKVGNYPSEYKFDDVPHR